jgi:hypothetical protein
LGAQPRGHGLLQSFGKPEFFSCDEAESSHCWQNNRVDDLRLDFLAPVFFVVMKERALRREKVTGDESQNERPFANTEGACNENEIDGGSYSCRPGWSVRRAG